MQDDGDQNRQQLGTGKVKKADREEKTHTNGVAAVRCLMLLDKVRDFVSDVVALNRDDPVQKHSAMVEIVRKLVRLARPRLAIPVDQANVDEIVMTLPRQRIRVGLVGRTPPCCARARESGK